jgi:hypothetical protein
MLAIEGLTACVPAYPEPELRLLAAAQTCSSTTARGAPWNLWDANLTAFVVVRRQMRSQRGYQASQRQTGSSVRLPRVCAPDPCYSLTASRVYVQIWHICDAQLGACCHCTS